MSGTCFELHKYLFYIPKLFTNLNTSEQNRIVWVWGESPLSDGVSWIYPQSFHLKLYLGQQYGCLVT